MANDHASSASCVTEPAVPRLLIMNNPKDLSL